MVSADILDTEYLLEPAPSGTLLRVSMSYRVSTRFNWYARPLAAALVGELRGGGAAILRATRGAAVTGRILKL